MTLERAVTWAQLAFALLGCAWMGYALVITRGQDLRSRRREQELDKGLADLRADAAEELREMSKKAFRCPRCGFVMKPETLTESSEPQASA